VWKGSKQKEFFAEVVLNFRSVKKVREIFDGEINRDVIAYKTSVV